MPDSPAAVSAAVERLPHAPPFRFLSGVEALTWGRRGRGWWTVSGDEAFFRGHFPGQPVVPGVLVAEALAQLCGLVGFDGPPGAPGGNRRVVVAQMNVRFRHVVAPPVTLSLDASLTRSLGALCMFDVAAAAGGRAVAQGSLVLAGSAAGAGGPVP